jgi:hypothetical protein
LKVLLLTPLTTLSQSSPTIVGFVYVVSATA